MLKWLKIKNFALVDEVEIEFKPGFNVLTGETGAGKSVVLGAVALVLGERADKSSIRDGSKRCEISAGLYLSGEIALMVKAMLDELDIEFDDSGDLQLRRVLSPTGTRNFINDSSVTLKTLKNLGDLLIDIHGANEHQSLLRPSTRLNLLDRYGKLDGESAKCADIHAKVKELALRREELSGDLPSKVEAEHLRLSISEIKKINPSPNEDEELNARHQVASNAKQILEAARNSVFALSESDESMLDRLTDINKTLVELERLDPEGALVISSQGESLVESVRELSSDLERYADKVEIDEREFQILEERLSEIQTLKRRYGPTLDDVLKTLENVEIRLESFENSEELFSKLDSEEKRLQNDLMRQAEHLSKLRAKAALKLAKEIGSELKKLDFKQSEFKPRLTRIEPGPKGADQVDFLFSANPGETAQPLKNVASSGELSRVMLAMKTVLAEADAVPILIFDEIDVNIGGKTAGKVGSELSNLAKTHQILCISHLAQVAAKADNHLQVDKNTIEQRTTTGITTISGSNRLKEIARMLGGGAAALEHAKELVKDSS